MIKLREVPRFQVSYAGLSFFLALYYALVVNIPVYKELTNILDGMEAFKIGFVISVPIFLTAALTIIFNVFSWPFIGRPFFIVVLITSSMVSYAGYNYGVMFDTNMITNIIQTDSSEATSYLSLRSIMWILLMGVLPALLLAKIKLATHISFPRVLLNKVISMVVAAAVILCIAALYYQDYASLTRNNSQLKKVLIPSYYVHSTVKYLKENYFSEPIPYQQIALDAKQSPKALAAAEEKPTLMVLVIGETARSQNFELNGYNRPTNEYTREQDVYSFQDVRSCGTATAISLPCMFSNMGRREYEADVAAQRDNLVDVLERAGVSVLWKENDGGDKGVSRNVPKVIIDRSREDDMCSKKSCYDMALLEGFDKEVQGLSGNRLIALHLMGSHGPTYYRRYPADMRKFEPDCPRADIENCTVQEIVNTYDNTILYSDYVIAQTIEKLKSYENQFNTMLVYVSDHGESLGENGLFLHGLPYSIAPDYQTHVPMLVWMSEGVKEFKTLNSDCMEDISQKKGVYSHDNLFHSVLGIMDVETKAYNADQDIFRKCRQVLF